MKMTRQEFMNAFRGNDWMNEHLTIDDRHEIFIDVLMGSSDLTKKLFEEVCNNYGTDLKDILQ